MKTFTNNSIHYICTHNIFYYIFLHIYKIFWNNTDKHAESSQQVAKVDQMRHDKSEMKERLRIMRWWWGRIMRWEIESLVCANNFVNPFLRGCEIVTSEEAKRVRFFFWISLLGWWFLNMVIFLFFDRYETIFNHNIPVYLVCHLLTQTLLLIISYANFEIIFSIQK